MSLMGGSISSAIALLPTGLAVAGTLVVLWLAHRFLDRRNQINDGYRFGKQTILLVLTLIGAIFIIITLPIPGELRGQLLGFMGIVLSAAVALSSTTLLGNALAGVMLQAIRSFRMGDFIRVGDHFGRVSERGLFHTEIQTEDRELTTFPNLFLVTNPVTTIRSSGTIISATVSLGYDISRSKIEPLLVDAADKTGLEDPFVYVLHLGDFSVTYRIAGMLRDVSSLISTRSRLRANAMDALHKGGVEIVSPNFMNQRIYPEKQRFIPSSSRKTSSSSDTVDPEKKIFDKAEQAEATEQLTLRHKEMNTEIDKLKGVLKEASDKLEKKQIQDQIDQCVNEQEKLAEVIEERKKHADESTEDKPK